MSAMYSMYYTARGGTISLMNIRRIVFRWIPITLGVMFMVGVVVVFSRTPSHDRDWEMGQEALPHIVFEGDRFTIENLRDFKWTGPFEAEPQYIEDSFDLRDMESVDVVISHFADFEGLAHIFLSFGFVDGRHVSISFETRREVGEEFSPLLGVLRQFEIIYVVGTDRDVLGVRTGHRDERVYVYKTVATPEITRKLFVRLAADINDIYKHPRFYNTITNNCTNEITREVEKIAPVDFPFSYKVFFPGYFDEVLYDMGLIDTSRPFEEVKRKHLVPNSLVDENADNYAVQVRNMLGTEQ